MKEELKKLFNKKVVILILGMVIGAVITAGCFKIFAKPNHKMMGQRMEQSEQQNPNNQNEPQNKQMNHKNGKENRGNKTNNQKQMNNNGSNNQNINQNTNSVEQQPNQTTNTENANI